MPKRPKKSSVKRPPGSRRPQRSARKTTLPPPLSPPLPSPSPQEVHAQIAANQMRMSSFQETASNPSTPSRNDASQALGIVGFHFLAREPFMLTVNSASRLSTTWPKKGTVAQRLCFAWNLLIKKLMADHCPHWAKMPALSTSKDLVSLRPWREKTFDAF